MQEEMGDAQDGLPGNGQPHPPPLGLLARFRAAVKRLKREVLALSFAMHDPRTGYLPRLLAGLAIAYALSPIDLIPDFIPVLGLVDDLLLLPALLWLAIRLIPADVMTDCRRRADEEPVRLARNWPMAAVVLLLWDAALLLLLHLLLRHYGRPGLVQREAALLGGLGAALVAGEAAWLAAAVRRERLAAAEGGPALHQPLLDPDPETPPL